MKDVEICIVAAKRTPQGRFLGALKGRTAVELACHAGEAVLEGLDRSVVDQVIVGNVLAAGQGMNIARQVGVRLKAPVSSPAFTVNMMCASGMQAVMLAAQAIRAGNARAVLCGGTESMSNAPYLLPRAREGFKLGDGKVVDSLLCDGLLDAFDGRHMATGVEKLARRLGISREQQDEFSARSQKLCAGAGEAGALAAELAPLPELSHDEHPRPETTVSSLAGLKPAFDPEGTITPGNASGINDGAAMLLLAGRETAEQHGWPVLALIEACATIGCAPEEMGLGPVHAVRRLCLEHGFKFARFDHIEINEAFAAQTLACLHELGLEPGEPRVNPNGGAIAMGHPIGASGARLVVHLAHQIRLGKGNHALATLCAGGGMGAAISLTRAG